jgi:hypothetical protein
MDKHRQSKKPAEQSHYLPNKAYLKRFAIPDQPSLIFQYQRGSEPVAIGLVNAARERDLYLFGGAGQDEPFSTETALGQLEDAAAPVLDKLEAATQDISLDLREKCDLMHFLAFQAFRTPAQRDAIGALTQEMLMKMMKFTADGKSQFERTLDEVAKLHPELPKEGKERLLQAFKAGEINVKVDPQYAMAAAMIPATDIFPCLMMKEMALIKAPKGSFLITSDHPVMLAQRIGLPEYLGGFAFSNIVWPLGRGTVLFLANPDQIPERPEDSPCNIRVGTATLERVNVTNKMTIEHAERFLFAPENNAELKAMFDLTKPPERFTLS